MLTFEVLRARLVKQVKLRIDNGEFTERGLSRILGISQSQTHNVLKGARSLQMQLADQILMKLGISAMDLLSPDELNAALRLKMAEWDRAILAAEESGLKIQEFDLTELFLPKKAMALSEVKTEKEARKMG